MISTRLKEIAILIDKDKVVIDVGTDHALLPCFLVENHISKKVYASDNKEGPLNKAIVNIKRFHYEDKIIPLLTDGLNNCPDDVEIVNINGMGFYTVKKILESNDLRRFSKIIVEVNNNSNLLRKYLSDNHYTIIDEKIIKDNFYYQVEVFNCDYHDKYSDLEIEYGPINIKNKEKIFVDFLKYEINRLRKIPNDKYSKKIKEIESIISSEV